MRMEIRGDGISRRLHPPRRACARISAGVLGMVCCSGTQQVWRLNALSGDAHIGTTPKRLMPRHRDGEHECPPEVDSARRCRPQNTGGRVEQDAWEEARQ